jgi:transposase-like protein
VADVQQDSLAAPSDESAPLSGPVEADEAYIGGKSPVFGIAQRGTRNEQGKPNEDGKIVATVVPDAKAHTRMPRVQTKVLPKSADYAIYNDEHGAYDGLERAGYPPGRVRHSQNVYVSGDVHTNTIEGFWSLLRRGISGVYHGVSTKCLQSYVDEYTFRYNHRDAGTAGMFGAFPTQIEKAPRTRWIPAPAPDDPRPEQPD